MSYGFNMNNNTNIPQNQPKIISPGNGKCKKGHNLEIREDRTTFQCDSCDKVWLPISYCRLACNFDLCKACGLNNISGGSGGQMSVSQTIPNNTNTTLNNNTQYNPYGQINNNQTNQTQSLYVNNQYQVI